MDIAQEHNDAIRHLREFADWLEAHPTATTRLSSTGVYDYRHDRDAFLEQVHALDAGEWDQEIGQNFGLVRKWGELTYMLYTAREVVCEQRGVEKPTVEWVVKSSVLAELGAQDRMDRIAVPETVDREIELAEFATEREREECRS